MTMRNEKYISKSQTGIRLIFERFIFVSTTYISIRQRNRANSRTSVIGMQSDCTHAAQWDWWRWRPTKYKKSIYNNLLFALASMKWLKFIMISRNDVFLSRSFSRSLCFDISSRADWLNFEWTTSVKWDGAKEIPDNNKYCRCITQCTNIIGRDINWE